MRNHPDEIKHAMSKLNKGGHDIFNDRKPCICGSSNNGDGTNNGGGDDKIYEGKPLGEVTVLANKMSELDKMRYDTGKDPITRSYLNGTTPRGRKISFGEGLGYQTEFWQGMQTLGEGFAYAFGGLLVAPYAGAVIGEGIAMSIPVVSSAMLEANVVSTYTYIQANARLVSWSGSLSIGLSRQASEVFKSPQLRALRMRHSWLRNPLIQAEKAAQNINLLPRRGDPFIPLDTKNPGAILYNLYKSTPEN